MSSALPKHEAQVAYVSLDLKQALVDLARAKTELSNLQARVRHVRMSPLEQGNVTRKLQGLHSRIRQAKAAIDSLVDGGV